MSIYDPVLEEASKPINTQDRNSLSSRAKKLSTSLQKYYGGGDKVVTSSPFSSRLAQSEAAATDTKRRSQLLPQMYEQTAKEEEAGAQIQNTLANAYDQFRLSSDELAEKQRQSDLSLDFFRQQGESEVEQQLKKLNFSAFQNKADRDDALTKAYADGNLNEVMTDAAINSSIKLSDIDTYWNYQMNELDQLWKDYAQRQQIDFEQFKSDLEAKSVIWGSIISGMFGVGSSAYQYNQQGE